MEDTPNNNVTNIADAPPKKSKIKEAVKSAADEMKDKVPMPRVLTREDIMLQQAIENTARALELLIGQVGNHINKTLNDAMEAHGKALEAMEPQPIANAEATLTRLQQSVPQNWVDVANMQLKLGMMSLRRALAQPTNF